ncbi:MAG: hypothetical protein AMXMBFR61_26210 [Fimbriimonadales bacterium]
MIWLAAAVAAAQGMSLPPLVGPIRVPGETFEVSVSRSAGFSTPPILAPLRGAEVLGPPHIAGATATWRVRATGGACELRCYALAPQDAAFIRVPVLTDVPDSPTQPSAKRPMRTAKPRIEASSHREAHLSLGYGLGARFVETTVGPGLQWVRDGRVVGSFAPLLMLEGNSGGAPSRVIRFQPSYRYVDPSAGRSYVRFLGEVLDMWKVEVVFRPAVQQSAHLGSPEAEARSFAYGALAAEVMLFPKFDGRLTRIAVSGWTDQPAQLRAGLPLRLNLTLEPPP